MYHKFPVGAIAAGGGIAAAGGVPVALDIGIALIAAGLLLVGAAAVKRFRRGGRG